MNAANCSQRHFPHLITPPLLPLSPPPKPFVDPVPRGELQPLSDITDPSIEQQRQLEQKLAEDDSIVSINSDPMLFDVSEVEQLYSPLRSDAQPDSPTSAKRKIVDLRVEGPLTPPLPTELPHKRIKTVLFPELLHEVIPDLPSTYVAEEDLLCSSGSFDDFFNENIAPLAEQVNQAVENEQLIEADATKRVQVPSIATVKLVPPWLEFASRSESRDGGFDAQFELLRGVKKDCMAHVQSWHGNSKAERQLSWLPFPPELGNVELSERINVGAVLDQLLRDIDSSEIVDSSAMVWRPEGLRILDDTWDDEDDGLEPRDFDIEELQLSDVLRRKTHDFKDRKDALTDPKEHRSDVAVSRMPSRFDDGTLFGDAFSASIALDKFLAGRAVPPTVVNQQRDIASSARRLSARLAVQEASQHNSKAHEHPLEVAPLSTTPAFVPPGIPNDLPSRPFIISSSILKSSRELYRTICTFYPNAEFIERDFASLRRSRDQHGSSDEGDIILSPSIGLIFTTLQKIKQRALPGQISNYYGIKERILTVSQRFERLIVFVSNDTTSSKVDERDCMAIAELSGFAAGLDAEVQICCIPSAETTLAQWVGSAMQRHGVDPEKGEMKLLQDETLWEQFLRRAGLNAFAAQVVLTELKPPVSPEGISSDSVVVPDYDASLYGIASFVRMKGEERVKRFAEALGGRRILERVSGVLDLRWKTSAGA